MTSLPPELPPPLPLPGHHAVLPGGSPAVDDGSTVPMPMATPVKRGRSGPRWPVIAWASLATMAVAYMGLAAVRPDLVARAVPPAGQSHGTSVAESNGGTVEHVESLRSTVKSLESEIATLRAKLATSERVPPPVDGQTAGTAVDPEATPVSGTDTPQFPLGPNLRLTPAPVAQAPSAGAQKTELAAASPPDASEDGIRIINGGAAAALAEAIPPAKAATDKKADQPATPVSKSKTPAATSKIETGSVEQPVKPSEIPAFGEAVVKPEPKRLGLAIGSGPTVDTLRINWSLISESNAEQLAKLQPRYKTSVDGNGLVYNLFAGPIKSKAQGRELCKALAKRAIPCAVIEDFGGEGL